jgi:hypothetical protein
MRSAAATARAAPAELQFLGRDHRTVQITATGIDFQAPAPETMGLNARTAATEARHFRKFVATARA